MRESHRFSSPLRRRAPRWIPGDVRPITCSHGNFPPRRNRGRRERVSARRALRRTPPDAKLPPIFSFQRATPSGKSPTEQYPNNIPRLCQVKSRRAPQPTAVPRLTPPRYHRVKHRLLSLLTVLSLLSCAAVILSWVRSSRSAPGRPAQPSNAAIQTRLARPLPVVQFPGVAPGDVVSFVRDVTGTSTDVNWPALEAAGVTPNTTVSLDATNARIGEALTALLGWTRHFCHARR